ncbi:hypothetical protein PGT21_035447 [Puccinia graminis f. sp. tritici]|uniref:Uncharacterized protein n=1 Tax=Puccinia graminis f. sp. tritici TaxID=56615 RepID=A0A5B0PZY7_PUCGR|nr:hypothetical protein PGT21_035447 [Puccinia graminis f. sp. tritici]
MCPSKLLCKISGRRCLRGGQTIVTRSTQAPHYSLTSPVFFFSSSSFGLPFRTILGQIRGPLSFIQVCLAIRFFALLPNLSAAAAAAASSSSSPH